MEVFRGLCSVLPCSFFGFFFHFFKMECSDARAASLTAGCFFELLPIRNKMVSMIFSILALISFSDKLFQKIIDEMQKMWYTILANPTKYRKKGEKT